MKKSKYIGKYDYIGYYTKQKEMWFFSNAEIIAGIKSKINLKIYDGYDEDDNLDQEDEFDVLEYYREELENNQEIDDNDPRIIEGRIIDSKTKEFVCNKYKDIKYTDLESKEFKFKTMEELYLITLDLINLNEEIILFQPVFIKNNMITKCDALVKKDGILRMIETKATSSTKLHHYLDILYQKNVIEDQPFNDNLLFNYELCIIKYEKLLKDQISFEITPYFNITKTAPSFNTKFNDLYRSYDEIIEAISMLKTGNWFVQPNITKSFPVSFNSILNNDFTELEIRGNESPRTNVSEKIELFLDLNNNFDNVIDELWNHKISMDEEKTIPINFKPSIQDNGDFKKSQFWNDLKEIYINQGYEIFKYSGTIVDQSKKALEIINATNKKKLVEDDIKGKNGNKILYEKCFIKKEDIINKANCRNLLNIKKEKSVYFDFETINTSIRSFDNTLPFSQIITQCSIIKSSNDDIKNWHCDNLVIDPRKISLEWFKLIVDSIYNGSNCSYIVYNKNFERSRLEEMKLYINEIDYIKKINIINNNLYDLADFFTPSKNNIILEELHGFYSIKKVLALIEKENPDIFNLCKCKDYKKLEIKNGGICQQETTKRFFNMLIDDEWNRLKEQLKIYCENDVRAMIAVELYINWILDKKEN